MKQIPSKENFNLKKAKYNPDKGVFEAKFDFAIIKDGKHHVESDSPVSTVIPSESLINCYRNLKPYFIRIMGWNKLSGIMNSANTPASEKTKLKNVEKFINQEHSQFMSDLVIIGVTWSGTDEKEAIIITAKYKTALGGVVAINTPRIVLSQSKLGIEENCEEIAIDLRDEVYDYIFNGKSDQGELGLGED